VLRRVFVFSLLVALLSACSSGGSSSPPSTPATEAPALANDSPLIVTLQEGAPAATATPAGPKRKVVVLDPGHGGDEIGASANGVIEKDSNLDFAFRVKALLEAQGIDVVLTRSTDARAAAQVPGYTATRSDLQARIDLANRAGGDLFVSLHGNGSTDTSQKGVEAWYDSKRDFAAEGKLMAGLAVQHVLSELRDIGYTAQDRGLYDGSCFRQREERCFTLFVIGGARETTRREILNRGGDPEALGFNGAESIYSTPAKMPAVLLELLIITNPQDAAILRADSGRDAIARGVAAAIVEFLSQQPKS
jgi:N-acetylmuramoyl-L-alanine amidase